MRGLRFDRNELAGAFGDTGSHRAYQLVRAADPETGHPSNSHYGATSRDSVIPSEARDLQIQGNAGDSSLRSE